MGTQPDEHPDAVAAALGAEQVSQYSTANNEIYRTDPDEKQTPHHRRSGKQRLQPIAWSKLGKLPKLKWLIKGVISDAAFSIFIGASGMAKTFLTILIAACIARGVPWCGRKVKQGPVLFIAAEGGRGIVARFDALAKHYEVDTEGVPLFVLPQAVDLRSPNVDIGDLLIAIRNTYDTAFALVIVDTLSASMAGGDENTPVDMGLLIGNCRRIQQETGAHVLLVHHLGKDKNKGARGHSSLHAAADTVLEVHPGLRDTRIILTVSKQRDGRTGDKFPFDLVVVELGSDEDGDPVTSCVVVPDETADDNADSNRNRVLPPGAWVAKKALFTALESDGVAPPPDSGVPDGIEKVVSTKIWRSTSYDLNISKGGSRAKEQAFARAKKELMERELVGATEDWGWVVPANNPSANIANTP